MENTASIKIIFLICLIGLIFSGCAKKEKVGADLRVCPVEGEHIGSPLQENNASQQVSKFTFSSIDSDGSANWQIEGDVADVGEDVVKVNKDVVFVHKDGATITTIKCAGPLVMDYKRNIAVFNKKVQIESPNGKMLSEKMVVHFDRAKKNISKVDATGSVCLIRGNSISTSKKATYFAEDGRAVLIGDPVVYLDSQEARQASKL